MEPPFDVFLSYNGQDVQLVRDVCMALRERQLRPWLDKEQLIPGRDWQKALETILETVPVVAVFLGGSGLGPWEEIEMRGSLQQLVHRGAFVIPVLLPGAPADPEIPLFLQAYTWVDLRGGLTREGIDQLVWGITEKKPAPPPDPPLGLSPPPLHNLPFESLGDLFKGRETELAELEAFAASPAQKKVLYGLGGIGKTRLSVEHAWRHGGRYRAAFFVRADTPAGLRAQIAALAGPDLLRLPERQAAAEEEVFGAVLTWLRENPGWLLILDNVDTKDAARAVQDVLPRLQNGKVLVTSRLATWPASLSRREIEKISVEEAARFLLKRTLDQREKTANDPTDAARLADLLDGLPLALEQAGAYIMFHRLPLAGYLDAWERTREEVLAWYDDRVMDYPYSLAVTWQQTIERLGPAPAALLRLMAYLAPDPIPIGLFESGEEFVTEAIQRMCEESGQAPTGAPVRTALASLAAYSMIEQEDGAVLVHRLVQEVTRNRLPAQGQRTWIELSLRLVNGFVPSPPNDVRTWPIWDLLRPHAAEVVLHADAAGLPEPTGRLMNELGLLLNTKGLFAEAERLYRRVLDIDQTVLGSDHQEVAIDLNNLATLLQDTNRLDEAEPLMRRALDIAEATSGDDHTVIASYLNNLAQLLQATNRLAEAEPLIRRALDIAEAGNDQPKIAIRLNNLAMLLQATDRLGEAEPLLRRALDIDQAVFGNDHPRVASDLNNLAQYLHATNRLDEAEPYMRRALEIDQTTFGNDHPDVARDLSNLAALLQATNRQDEAEPLMRRALDIEQAAFGNDHSDVAISLNNLAQILQATNRLDEAEALMRRVLEIDQTSFGNDHPEVAIDLNNLAGLLKNTNRLDEAEPLLRRSLDILERSFGPDHSRTKLARKNLEHLLMTSAEEPPRRGAGG